MPIHTDELRKHLTKLREIQILLMGAAAGVLFSLVAQLFLKPLSITVNKESSLPLELKYGEIELFKSSTFGYFIILIVLFFIIVMGIIFLFKRFYKIPEVIRHTIIYDKSSIDDFTRDILNALKDIINLGYGDLFSLPESRKIGNKYIITVKTLQKPKTYFGSQPRKEIVMRFEIFPKYLDITHEVSKKCKELIDEINKRDVF